MTPTQMSEKIRDHLTKQKARSVSEGGSCKYRNDSGLMCAVGCLIPDDVYYRALEGKMSSDLIVSQALEKTGLVMDETMTDVASAWQRYHDSNLQGMSYNQWTTVVYDTAIDHSPQAMHEHLKRNYYLKEDRYAAPESI